MSTRSDIPVVLFAYARTTHLARVLDSLRRNQVPLIEAYADGAKGPADRAAVEEARRMLRAIDWCEVRLVERPTNLGLGQNILAGVTSVAERYDAFIVWEDDLIAVPGTYAWLCAALRCYAADPRVMSVTGWTHPRVTPADVGELAYFDGRAECWVWGAWARSWAGMTAENARAKLALAAKRMPADAYGGDLPPMAEREERQNIWAVRWLYHHFQHGGLCVRPPWSMVEHIGIDASATNAQYATAWANPPLRPAPAIPAEWPEPRENPACRRLWRAANPAGWRATAARAIARGRRVAARVIPAPWLALWRPRRRPRIYCGDFATWEAALRASRGYDDPMITEKTIAAARAVRDGLAAWDRDTVVFQVPAANAPLLRALQAAAQECGGRLHVLDFGGGLGSTWWQHVGWLGDMADVRWSIVEQPALVSAGEQEFTRGPVRYFPSIEACFASERPEIALLSSVLPYLEHPDELIRELNAKDFQQVIIDRTGFVEGPGHRLVVQHVPPSIYEGSYPCWFFNRAKLLAAFGEAWEVVDEWVNDDALDIRGSHRGLRLRRRITK